MMAVRFSPDTKYAAQNIAPMANRRLHAPVLGIPLEHYGYPPLVGVIGVRGEDFPAVVLMGMVWMFLSKLYFSNNSKINALKLEVSDCHLEVGALGVSYIQGADMDVGEGWHILGVITFGVHLLP